MRFWAPAWGRTKSCAPQPGHAQDLVHPTWLAPNILCTPAGARNAPNFVHPKGGCTRRGAPNGATQKCRHPPDGTARKHSALIFSGTRAPRKTPAPRRNLRRVVRELGGRGGRKAKHSRRFVSDPRRSDGTFCLKIGVRVGCALLGLRPQRQA